MLEGGEPGVVINTASKQGITNPPGNGAYNLSKAGVKKAIRKAWLTPFVRKRTARSQRTF